MDSNHFSETCWKLSNFSNYGPFCFYLLQKYFKTYQKVWEDFLKNSFTYFKIENSFFDLLGNGGHREMMQIGLTKS